MPSVYVASHGKPVKLLFNNSVYRQTMLHPQMLLVDGIDFVTTMVPEDAAGEAILDIGDNLYDYIAFNFDVYKKSSENANTAPGLLKVVAISRHGNYSPHQRTQTLSDSHAATSSRASSSTPLPNALLAPANVAYRSPYAQTPTSANVSTPKQSTTADGRMVVLRVRSTNGLSKLREIITASDTQEGQSKIVVLQVFTRKGRNKLDEILGGEN